MKLSKRNQHKIRMYSHHDHDVDEFDEPWFLISLLGTIIGLWWGFIHLVDKFTFNFMVWWAEPFTLIPLIIYLILYEKFGKNPLHWWPVVWGTKIKLPEEERITIYPVDSEDILTKYGGPLNVYVEDFEHVKFRKESDAVIFSLRNF